MNEYEKIIEEINSGLTGDFSTDFDYLNKQAEKYKQHPMSQEIIREIGRKIAGIIPKEHINDFSNMRDQYFESLENKTNNAMNFISQHNYEPAKKLLNEYLNDAMEYKEDEYNRFFCFSNIIEEYCSKEKLNISKKICCVGERKDEVYKLLAYIAVEEKNYSLALEYYEKGLYFNPMNVQIRFGMGYVYAQMKDFEKACEIYNNAYEYIYDPTLLAKYYSELGSIYFLQQKYDIAYALFMISMYYENTELAFKFIININLEKSSSEIFDLLKQYNIPITISQSNLAQLQKLLTEQDIIKDYPSLVPYLNSVISIFTTQIDLTPLIERFREIFSKKVSAVNDTVNNKFSMKKILFIIMLCFFVILFIVLF